MESGMSSGAYGHAAGANINIVTKSGTEKVHADGWEFLRNNVMDARPYFAPSVTPYRYNQFGGAVGGPLAIPKSFRQQSTGISSPTTKGSAYDRTQP